jgi:LysM repeat protein
MMLKRPLQLLLIAALMLTTLAFTTAAQASSTCGTTYVVQPGDWVYKIARTCGVTTADLYAANPWLYNYYYIYPGQVLVIPGGGQTQPPPPTTYCGPGTDAYGSYYIVCPGDTLYRISNYYGVSVQYLQYRNGITNPNLIYAGQVLRIY